MAHEIRIMGEVEENGERVAATRPQHRELLEATAGQMLGLMPRIISSMKQHARHTGTDDIHNVLRELGASQVPVLYKLMKGKQLTTELSRTFNVTTPTMTRIIDGLVEKGYVERHPHPEDRRCIYLQLTESGKEIGEAAQEAGRRMLVEYLSPLSEAQLTDVARAFSHLYALIPDGDGTAPGCSEAQNAETMRTED